TSTLRRKQSIYRCELPGHRRRTRPKTRLSLLSVAFSHLLLALFINTKEFPMKSKSQVYFLLSLLAPFLLLLVAVGWMLLLSQSNTTHGTVFAALSVRHLDSTTGASHRDSKMQPPVNTDCTLIVPAHPLTAQGLATPYQLIATDPHNGPCNESNKLQAAFVQGAIIDPVTGVISIY